MAIVAGADEVQDPTGAQTITVGEPSNSGMLPAAESGQIPDAELGQLAANAGAPATGNDSSAMFKPGAGGSALRDKIIAMGMNYLGTPYVWGGTRPGGFDCSGLLQYIFGKEGVNLPRVSYQQANYGQRIGIGNLRPGDLVAWDENSRNNGADHIALYIGNGQILEAPHTGATVRVRTLGKNEGAWGVALTLPGDH